MAADLSQDVLTVFQFYGYILQHEVQDMETHLQHLAREGMSRKKDVHQHGRVLHFDTVFVCLVRRCVCGSSVQGRTSSVSYGAGGDARIFSVA